MIAGLTNGIKSIANGGSFFKGFKKGWSQSWQIILGAFQWDNDLRVGQNSWNAVVKCTWEAPQTAIGLFFSQALNIGTVVNEVHCFRGATVLDTDLKRGAVAIGSYLIGPVDFKPDFTDHLFAHEFGHYLQSKRVGPLYINFVGLPSLTDIIFWPEIHDTRWYETHASRLAADYFDKEFGSGVSGYFVGSENHFDRNSFVTGTRSSYRNVRNGRRFQGDNPLESKFHRSDVLLSGVYNGGLGLFGYLQ